MIFEIIQLILIIILALISYFSIRKLYIVKIAFDEILAQMMSDHQQYLNFQKTFLKEAKICLDNMGRLLKDINIIRSHNDTLKDKLKELNVIMHKFDDVNKQGNATVSKFKALEHDIDIIIRQSKQKEHI